MKNMRRDIEAVRASASMPLVSRPVEINGKLYLDGGLADSIPLLHAVTDGCRKNVVVMTKEVGYRRVPSKHLELIKARYAKYPKVYERMANRAAAYNQQLDYLEAELKNGTAFLIQPSHPNEVGRIEKNRKKLRALYEEGYQEAARRKEELIAFLEK